MPVGRRVSGHCSQRGRKDLLLSTVPGTDDNHGPGGEPHRRPGPIGWAVLVTAVAGLVTALATGFASVVTSVAEAVSTVVR